MFTYECDLNDIAASLGLELSNGYLISDGTSDDQQVDIELIRRHWPDFGTAPEIGIHSKIECKTDIFNAIDLAVERGHSTLYLYFQGGVI